LLVLEFAEIHDSANRRLLLRGDFHKVEAKIFGTLKGLDSFEDAELIAFRSNDTDRCVADLFVDPLRFTVEGDGTISYWVKKAVNRELGAGSQPLTQCAPSKILSLKMGFVN
jgi:hypothetical protein